MLASEGTTGGTKRAYCCNSGGFSLSRVTVTQREDRSQCSVVTTKTISRTHPIRRRMILVATTEEEVQCTCFVIRYYSACLAIIV